MTAWYGQDPTWVILSILAIISFATLAITIHSNKVHDKHRSSQILSDILRTTREFRGAIDKLLDGLPLEPKDRYDLMRVMTYLEVLALCRRDKLIKDEYVTVVYKLIFMRLTDRKMIEILGTSKDVFEKNTDLYRGLRDMRDSLV